MLDAALRMIEEQKGDLTNKVLEVTMTDSGGIEVEIYSLPTDS